MGQGDEDERIHSVIQEQNLASHGDNQPSRHGGAEGDEEDEAVGGRRYGVPTEDGTTGIAP